MPNPEDLNRTFLEEIESWAPSYLSGVWSAGFVGATLALVADASADAFGQATMMHWLLEPTAPDDALPFAGRERRMRRYPSESAVSYRTRLWDAWTAYAFGGSAKAIEDQLAIIGMPGHLIYSGVPVGYWSQFRVFFPIGTHPVTGSTKWGAWVWGDGSPWGPIGITLAELETIRGIINKWRNSQWICRELIFQLSGWQWGTGKKWGEPGLTWGGLSVRVGA